MKRVLDHIEGLTRSLACLEYFQLLQRPGTLSDVEIMGQGLSFFVLSFQDMLRLNAALVTDPRLADIANEQRRDDAGHDVWFLDDLRQTFDHFAVPAAERAEVLAIVQSTRGDIVRPAPAV